MIDELSALRRIKERFKNVSKNVLLGIGDDAAAVKIHPEKLLLVTTDSQVDSIHFTKGFISAKDLGRRSVAVSVSDIGAMGGVPRFFLASIGFSRDEDEGFLEDLMDGFQKGAEEFEMELIGGNLSASGNLFIDITVLGEVEPNTMVKRGGAGVGDVIYVSGTVGDSALGLRVLQGGEKGKEDEYLIERHISPRPRLALGRTLAEKGLPTSMIDISDGLILDLERITVEHGLGAEVYIDRIPLSPCYRKRVSDFISDPYGLALSGGEDYELLFTSPSGREEEIREVSRALRIGIVGIGYVIPEPTIRVLGSTGEEVKIDKRGFIHFIG
ncbi:MAG TPA: thiamine-phosphate kinase [Thermodesulfobacteriota bacterium]|nr:thiamine-phosphate kinase [Thermodesulfobacteriota bacterium]